MSRPAQTASKAAQGLLPQIEAAITYLQQEIAQIRVGQKDNCLHDLIADPLPRDQFQALLQVWKLPPVPVELSKLFVQLEELREKEAREEVAAEALAEEKRDATVRLLVEQHKSQPSQDAVNHDEEGDAASETTVIDGDKADALMVNQGVGADGNTGDVEMMEPAAEAKREHGIAPSPAAIIVNQPSHDPVAASTPAVPIVAPAPSSLPFPQPAIARPTIVSAPTTVSTPTPTSAPTPTPSAMAPGVSTASKTTDAAREVALVNLRALRKSMMLDVLSKIVSVARSKGVDPAMFSSRQTSGNDPNFAFVDLEMIQRDVARGAVAEWEHFAQQVYLFCQHVIAESDKHDQPDAKQKGVELLHFAKTLTETLRKASLKKEETLMQKTTPTAPSFSSQQPPSPVPAVALPPPKAVAEPVKNDAPTTMTTPPPPQPAAVPVSDQPPTRPSIVEAPKAGATPAATAESLTPHRASARLRQRENSVSDSPTPSPKRRGRPPKIRHDDAADAAKRKRPRTSTASENSTNADTADEQSESESQVSTAEAASSQGESDTKPRQRKRRPLPPATRVSSRMLSRRAAEAAAAAAAAAAEEEEDDAKGSGSPANDEDSAADTAQDEKDGDETAATGDDADAPPSKPVLLTKSGRPRKKPGRKPKRQLKEAD